MIDDNDADELQAILEETLALRRRLEDSCSKHAKQYVTEHKQQIIDVINGKRGVFDNEIDLGAIAKFSVVFDISIPSSVEINFIRKVLTAQNVIEKACKAYIPYEDSDTKKLETMFDAMRYSGHHRHYTLFTLEDLKP
jgi:hypothetical protein